MNILSSYPLGNVTSFKCGGRADFFVEPTDLTELVNLLNLHKGKNFFMLGNGTNTLCPDEGYNGLVIRTTNLNKIEIIEKNENYALVYCQCGVNFFALNNFMAENSLAGFEFSYGIPATVGGALVMNSGAFGGSVGEFVNSVEIYNKGEVKTLSHNQISFAYRESSLKNFVILSAILKFRFGDKSEILQKQAQFWRERTENQPLNLPSAGSIFKRQNNIIPSKIIDELGLKGKTIGGASVSSKHAGFIVNNGGATATDILNLIATIESEALNKNNIKLTRELIIMK